MCRPLCTFLRILGSKQSNMSNSYNWLRLIQLDFAKGLFLHTPCIGYCITIDVLLINCIAWLTLNMSTLARITLNESLVHTYDISISEKTNLSPDVYEDKAGKILIWICFCSLIAYAWSLIYACACFTLCLFLCRSLRSDSIKASQNSPKTEDVYGTIHQWCSTANLIYFQTLLVVEESYIWSAQTEYFNW